MQGQIPRTLAERIVCDENILTEKPVIIVKPENK